MSEKKKSEIKTSLSLSTLTLILYLENLIYRTFWMIFKRLNC